MRKIYLYAFFSFLIVVLAIGYFLVDSSQQAPAENDQSGKNIVYRSYDGGVGKAQWLKVISSYEACGRGELQSPINIEVKETIDQAEAAKLADQISLNYDQAIFAVENDGHTIEANATTAHNSIVIDNKEYKFTGMHFYSPSEHQLNGQYFDMEAHLYHESEEGDLVTIGLFIERGEENEVLAELWDEMPSSGSEAVRLLKNPINLQFLLPEQKSVYQYMGSLTAPPCTEGVNWFIMEHPIEMSDEQIKRFNSIFVQNNRSIQQLNGRDVYKFELN
ncbi:carbonic anhydrase family protein [Lysinibacillus yapensis]|uniref:carbonic anhydrase n=1 Tax=Ureibacillus yapensis TaxID=2304605 RepID=A0A396SI18_9BACL|nr:carbonic anhydrase family protein [Lysinibacillus yapensis]RHW38365.1 carbonic anhydrase family protein [Lysinibacillus yapensis]